jgi:hypothetical protein
MEHLTEAVLIFGINGTRHFLHHRITDRVRMTQPFPFNNLYLLLTDRRLR